MADPLRPTARAALWRWREVLAGLALAGLALAVALSTFGITRWIALAAALAGLALGWAALQRLRFGRGAAGRGRGVVQVDERRLTYWGPLAGGVVEMGELLRLDLDPRGRPAHWLLTGPGGAVLAVPVDALGADALLDLFAGLPGLGVERMIGALAEARAGRGGAPVTLWRASGAPAGLPSWDRPPPPRLH